MDNDLIPVFNRFDNGEIRYGYVNNLGILKIPYMYEYASYFVNGLASVRDYNNHLVGYINKCNDVVIDFKYDYGNPFFNDNTWVCKGGLWGVISKCGTCIIPYKYLRASSFKNGVSIVQNSEGKWGVIDICDKVILDFIYDYLYSNDNITFDSLIGQVVDKIDIYGKRIVNKVNKLTK